MKAILETLPVTLDLALANYLAYTRLSMTGGAIFVERVSLVRR